MCRNLARRDGIRVLFLSVYSPDLNSIEKTWAQMKMASVDLIPKEGDLTNAITQYFEIA